MKRRCKRILAIVLSSLIANLAVPSTAFALSGYTFTKADTNPVRVVKNDSEVNKYYNKAVNLTKQYNALVDQLNAMDLRVSSVIGTVVSQSPFTVEYKSPTSEYVKVGNDYIYVTKHYYAVISNPQDGNQINSLYTGFHVNTGSATKGNDSYVYYGSCGSAFYDLYKKSRDVVKKYNAAIESMDAADSNSLDDTLNAGENFYDTYTPLFRKYLEGEPGRKVVECRTESSGVTVSGSTVFKIGCPAYVTSEGHMKAIEYDEFYKPVYNVTPVIKNGTTMIPVRPLVDGLIDGDTRNALMYSAWATVDYDKNTKKITVDITGTTSNPDCIRNKNIELTIGSSTAYVNGVAYEMGEAAQIIKGKTMIPLRAVGEMLSCDVEWLKDGQYILITPMSVDALKAKQETEQRAADPFWSIVERIEIDGKEYYHMPCDLEFWGCEYSFPVHWERHDDSRPVYFGYNEYNFDYDLNEVEIYDSGDGYTRRIKSGNSAVISFVDVTNEENVGLTVEEFCRQNECYVSDFSDNIVISETTWGVSRFYHLALEDGKIGAVTQIIAPDNSQVAKVWEDYGVPAPELDTDSLDPIFVTLLKSFKRTVPSG